MEAQQHLNAGSMTPIDERPLDQAYQRYVQRKRSVALTAAVLLVPLAIFLTVTLLQSGRLIIQWPLAAASTISSSLPPSEPNTDLPAIVPPIPTESTRAAVTAPASTIMPAPTEQPATVAPTVIAVQGQTPQATTASVRPTSMPTRTAVQRQPPQAAASSARPTPLPTRAISSAADTSRSRRATPVQPAASPNRLPVTGEEEDAAPLMLAAGSIMAGIMFILSLTLIGARRRRCDQ